MIWEDLNLELVFPKLEVRNSSEIMEKMGSTFIKEGLCKESYINALIKREAEFPTGIDVDGFGIAIPHTDVSHVNVAGIGVATLKESVKFIQMGTDDEEVNVKVVVMLAIDNPNEHLSMLQNILNILQDQNVLKALAEAKEKEEIIEIIKKKENE